MPASNLFACLPAATVLLVSLSASAAEPFVSSPDGLNSFRRARGVTIEKVAGPPLVQYPLFACFDDQGTLYVAEGTGTNLPGTELVKSKLGKITRLEDSDHDGKFDRSTTFA